MSEYEPMDNVIDADTAWNLYHEAITLVQKEPYIRLGQALLALDKHNLLPTPWPKLFHEKDEKKVLGMYTKYCAKGIKDE